MKSIARNGTAENFPLHSLSAKKARAQMHQKGAGHLGAVFLFCVFIQCTY